MWAQKRESFQQVSSWSPALWIVVSLFGPLHPAWPLLDSSTCLVFVRHTQWHSACSLSKQQAISNVSSPVKIVVPLHSSSNELYGSIVAINVKAGCQTRLAAQIFSFCNAFSGVLRTLICTRGYTRARRPCCLVPHVSGPSCQSLSRSTARPSCQS